MSEWCQGAGNRSPAWTCVLPVGHDGDHVYSLWREIAIISRKQVVRVLKYVKDERDSPKSRPELSDFFAGWNACRYGVLSALDGKEYDAQEVSDDFVYRALGEERAVDELAKLDQEMGLYD